MQFINVSMKTKKCKFTFISFLLIKIVTVDKNIFYHSHSYFIVRANKNEVFDFALIAFLHPRYQISLGTTWIDTIRFLFFNSGTINMMLSAPSPFTSLSIPISYNITYSNLPNVRSACVNIATFKTGISTSFSINITISQLAVNSMMATLAVYEDTSLTMQRVSYMVVGNSVDFLEIQVSCFLCSVINKERGDRSETRNGFTTFINKKALQSQVFFTGFQMENG